MKEINKKIGMITKLIPNIQDLTKANEGLETIISEHSQSSEARNVNELNDLNKKMLNSIKIFELRNNHLEKGIVSKNRNAKCIADKIITSTKLTTAKIVKLEPVTDNNRIFF